jgi:VWFA-related protein
MRKYLWPIIISICLISAQMLASQQEGVIRVTTRLVQISVVVHDKNGAPVRDLTKDDFAVFDKGQEQKILFFSKESDDAPPIDSKPLAPGVVSNRFANFTSGGETHVAPLPSSLTVILLDGLNTAFTDQHYARAGLIKFLNQLKPSDRVAIYTLSNGLRVLHDFTSDTASLLAALAKHQNQDSSALAASSYEDSNTGDDTLDAFIDQANERISNFYQARRIETTLDALETIAQHLAGMPGRKNLIWLSSSFPSIVGQRADGSFSDDFNNFTDNVQKTLRALNDIGVAIYPVDARGVISAFAAMPSMDVTSRGRGPRGRGPAPMDQRAQNQIIQTQGVMRDIADRTGGRAFLNSNDLTAGIRRAMDDTRVSYVLAYSPSHNQWDGKFREIKIKLKRPNLEAQYRKGYFAYPESPTDAKSRQAVLAQAATAPLVSTGLSLGAVVAEASTPKNPRAVIRLAIDAHEIAFGRNTEGKEAASVDFYLVVFDDKGKPLHQQGQSMNFNLEQAAYEQLLQKGFVMSIDSETPPNSARARLVVHDVSSGAVGSVDLPLK